MPNLGQLTELSVLQEAFSRTANRIQILKATDGIGLEQPFFPPRKMSSIQSTLWAKVSEMSQTPLNPGGNSAGKKDKSHGNSGELDSFLAQF